MVLHVKSNPHYCPVSGFTKSATSDKPSKINKTRKSSSSSESSSDEEDFAEDCLKAHNDYRKKHGAQPLKLSKKVSVTGRRLTTSLRSILIVGLSGIFSIFVDSHINAAHMDFTFLSRWCVLTSVFPPIVLMPVYVQKVEKR